MFGAMADKGNLHHTVAVYTLYILVCRWTSAAVHYRENPEYLLELCDTKQSNDVIDEGCREAKSATLVKRHTHMSSIWCAKQCWKDKFKYSLVKRGDQCLCSQVLGSKVNSQKCNIPCSSAKSQNCGGYHVAYVLCTGFVPFNWKRLETMYNAAMKLKQKRAQQRTKTMAKYDNGKCIKWRPKKSLTFDSEIMTAEMCVVHCFHYKYVYAMLTLSTYCKCTSDSPEVQSSGRTMEQILERGEKTSCTKPCGGNRKQICGGAIGVNSVHLTGHYDSKDHVSSKKIKKLPALESNWRKYFMKNKEVLKSAARGNGIVLRAAASTTPGSDVDILDKGSGQGNTTAKVVAGIVGVGLVGIVAAIIVSVVKGRKKETPVQQSERDTTKPKKSKKSRRSGKKKRRKRDKPKDGSQKNMTNE